MRISPRIGGPNALSWPAFWVMLAASVAINLPDRHTTWNADTWWRNLVCNLIAVSAMFGVMLALRAVMLRHAADHPRPWRALAIFAVGAAVRGLMLGLLIPAVSVGQAQPVYRIITSLLVLVPLLAITAGLVDLVRTSAARRAVLQAEAEHLVVAEREAVARTTELRQGALARVRALLLQRLEAIRAGAARPAELEADLRNDVERVIRPMSHELFEGEVEPAPSPSVPPTPRVSWGDVWRSASLGSPFRAFGLASLVTLAMVNGLVNYNGAARGFPYAVAVWVIVYVVFMALDRIVTAPMRRMRVGARSATLVIASIAGLAVAGFLCGVLYSSTGGVAPWRLPISMIAIGPIVALALSVAQGFRRQVAAVGAEQESANAGLRVSAALAASERRHEERRLSRALHGPVQTAVTAAAMRIEAGDDEGAEALLVDAVGQLELDDHDVAPVTEALGHVAAVWDGLCVVSTDLEARLEGELDARPTAATAFIDICTEACSNAVRHGGARHVTMRARHDQNAVELEIRDDGAPGGRASPAGLGTALLDEVTLDWERYRDGGLTVMRATLPLG